MLVPKHAPSAGAKLSQVAKPVLRGSKLSIGLRRKVTLERTLLVLMSHRRLVVVVNK